MGESSYSIFEPCLATSSPPSGRVLQMMFADGSKMGSDSKRRPGMIQGDGVNASWLSSTQDKTGSASFAASFLLDSSRFRYSSSMVPATYTPSKHEQSKVTSRSAAPRQAVTKSSSF